MPSRLLRLPGQIGVCVAVPSLSYLQYMPYVSCCNTPSDPADYPSVFARLNIAFCSHQHETAPAPPVSLRRTGAGAAENVRRGQVNTKPG
jgi:hypothetical protein